MIYIVVVYVRAGNYHPIRYVTSRVRYVTVPMLVNISMHASYHTQKTIACIRVRCLKFAYNCSTNIEYFSNES